MDDKLGAGTGHCLCGECGEYFNSVSAFDKHRTGNYSDGTRRCLTQAELTAKGWAHNARGLWITSVYAREESEAVA